MKQLTVICLALACLVSVMNARGVVEQNEFNFNIGTPFGGVGFSTKARADQELFNFGINTPFGGVGFSTKSRAGEAEQDEIVCGGLCIAAATAAVTGGIGAIPGIISGIGSLFGK